MPAPDEDELLRRFARDFSVDRHGRMRVRQPARPYALAGLALGLVLSLVLAVVERGAFVTIGVLQLAAFAALVVCVVAFLVSLAARGRGRRLAARALGAAVTAGLALIVVGVAAELVDLGLRP